VDPGRPWRSEQRVGAREREHTCLDPDAAIDQSGPELEHSRLGQVERDGIGRAPPGPDRRDPVGRFAAVDVLPGRARDLQVRDGGANRRDHGIVDVRSKRLDPITRPARVEMHRTSTCRAAGDRIGDELLQRHGHVRVIVAAVAAVERTLDHEPGCYVRPRTRSTAAQPAIDLPRRPVRRHRRGPARWRIARMRQPRYRPRRHCRSSSLRGPEMSDLCGSRRCSGACAHASARGEALDGDDRLVVAAWVDPGQEPPCMTSHHHRAAGTGRRALTVRRCPAARRRTARAPRARSERRAP
jgi:hypothetical protein